MTILLSVLAWLLCGFAGAYIGWRFIDKRAYNMEVLPLIVMCIVGPATLFAATAFLIFTAVNYKKFFNKIVFEKVSK